MISIALCDDESEVNFQLEGFLLKLEKIYNVKFDIEVFLNGEELCKELINHRSYDLIFLDIELKELDGIHVGNIIRNQLLDESTQIVYVSSKESYAMNLFRIRPLDFIIKPLSLHSVHEVFKVAYKILKNSNLYFEYKNASTLHKVLIKEIYYFESSEKRIRIIMKNNIDVFYGKLSDVCEKLANIGFINIHKSYFINYDYVKKFEYDKITMLNDDVLPISQSNRKEVRRLQIQIREERH